MMCPLRRSLAFNLEQAGYSVHTAASAEDGIALVEQTPPDLVLLDINLPGMDGLDACANCTMNGNWRLSC